MLPSSATGTRHLGNLRLDTTEFGSEGVNETLMVGPTNNSIVDVIEECIGFPLDESYISNYEISPNTLHELSFALMDYYEHFTLPERQRDELRPYISAQLTASMPLGMDYVFGQRRFSGRDSNTGICYSYDANDISSMSFNVKKYLLFCHRIFIQDPIPYLLDYFRLDPTSESSIARLPAIKQILKEYARLKPLLQQKIVVPLSDEIFGIITTNDTMPDSEMLNRIEKRLIERGRGHLLPIAPIVGNISVQQYKVNRVKDRMDLFFPNSSWIVVFKELLGEVEKAYSSKDVLEPFEVGILGKLTVIDSDAVSVNDLLTMRDNNELFVEWRQMMSSVLKMLYENENYYSDINKEFVELVRGEFDDWKSRFKVETARSPVLRAFADTGKELIVGVTAGAATGAVAGAMIGGPPGAVVGGAIGGVSPAAMTFMKSFFRVAYERPKVVSLRRHFVAAGITEMC